MSMNAEEYQFQFTKLWNTLFVVIIAIITFFLAEFLGIYLKLNFILILVLSFTCAFLLFRILRKTAVYTCFATLNDDSVSFRLDKDLKEINFNNLISYKVYYGKNGPILYLKNQDVNLKIAANNNFCKPDDFRIFCENIIIKLDKYKRNTNAPIIHEGSIFTTKKMLYFLSITTSIYLISFLFEKKDLRLPIGLGGGLYLFSMWIVYVAKRNDKSF